MWRAHQQREYYCPKLLPGQLRHSKLSDSLVQEATVEMIRRHAHIADTLFRLRSELQHDHRHTERQSDEFQQCQAQLGQLLGRSNTEGAQLRNLFEQTRTVNASIAPEVTRLHAPEAQLSTSVSTIGSQETELQGQLLNLHQENARVNALVNRAHKKSGIDAARAIVKRPTQSITD